MKKLVAFAMLLAVTVLMSTGCPRKLPVERVADTKITEAR